MPNRLIKESITTSEDIDVLSAGAEILFYRLMVKADDFGIYYGNAKLIRSNCFPLRVDDVPADYVEEWLKELDRAGLIIRYEAPDGRIYLKFSKWEKHQQIRSKKSKFPQFDDNCKQIKADDINGYQMISDDIKNNQMISNAPVIQSNPIQSEYESISESVSEYKGSGEAVSDKPQRTRRAPSAPSTDLLTDEHKKERIDHYVHMLQRYVSLGRETTGVKALALNEGISLEELKAAYVAAEKGRTS